MLKDFEDFCNSGKARERMIESHTKLADQYYEVCMRLKDTVGTENEDYIRARSLYAFHSDKVFNLLLEEMIDTFPKKKQKKLRKNFVTQ